MSNRLAKMSAAFSTTKMKIIDWTLALLSLGVGIYFYTMTDSSNIAFWWTLGGSLGVIFSIWRPIDRLQNFMQRSVINKE